MNIAKKLLFALLLCGATFAVACEDEGGGDDNGAATGTAAVGAECKKGSTDKTKLCGTGLACVADSAGATSGKCATKCNTVADNDATCAGKDATKNACAAKDGVETNGKVNVCVKPTGPQPVEGTVTAGNPCITDSADKDKKCKGDLVCVTSTASDTNEGKCSIVCSSDTDCAAAGPATHCGDLFKQGKADGQKACTMPAGPQPVDYNGECNKKAGADAKTCGTGLVCVGATDNAETGTCKHTCAVAGDCTDEKGGTACNDVPAEKVVATTPAAAKVCGA